MALAPLIRFSQFDVSFPNPSGLRHLTSASGYVKQLSTNAGQYLDFGSMNISNGKKTSPTKSVVCIVDNMNGATEQVFNLRFWISSIADWGPGTYYFNGLPSGVWVQNIALTDASGKFIPTALPSGQNLFRQDGAVAITASGLDSQVSEFIYLSVTADQDVPPGVYGGDSGGYTYRLTLDYK